MPFVLMSGCFLFASIDWANEQKQIEVIIDEKSKESFLSPTNNERKLSQQIQFVSSSVEGLWPRFKNQDMTNEIRLINQRDYDRRLESKDFVEALLTLTAAVKTWPVGATYSNEIVGNTTIDPTSSRLSRLNHIFYDLAYVSNRDGDHNTCRTAVDRMFKIASLRPKEKVQALLNLRLSSIFEFTQAAADYIKSTG
ncbi:MAG: hypothetical protein AAF664_23030, partial [Planctomycetota bacterium]